MRSVLIVAAGLLAVPCSAWGQLDVTLNLGVHFDRLDQPHRLISTPDHQVYSTRGEAPTLGVRATYWTKSRFGLEAGIATSQNRSWEGGGRVPIPAMTKRTSFASLAAVWRPFDPARRIQPRLGFGPAAIVHSGSGESLLARQWDLGVVASAGAHVRLGRSLQLGLDVQNYRFSTDFKQYSSSGRTISRGEVIRRSEWLLLPAIRWTP